MADSRDQPDIETLSYRSEECPAKPSLKTLGFNSVVIKPETRVNKAEDAECKTCVNGLVPKMEGDIILPDDEPCPDCSSEQPNKNLMIIEEIEGLISQVNEKLDSLPTQKTPINSWNKQKHYKNQALEEIDLFQKTTLFELRKVFE